MPNSMRPGDVLAGRYRMVDLLNEARGGLFFRAWDGVLARHVAIHIIDKDDDRADTLMEAARTSALLLDPRLLRVLDAGTTGDLCYVVNEWGEGLSLDHLLDEEPLNPRRGAWIVSEVAELVSAAHSQGILHGRLVPEAVMIDEAGAVKVIGFAVDAALHGQPTMSAESEVVDVASLLYAVLTGKWPGRSGCRLPPAPQEHGRPLRPRQVRAGVPRILDTLCDEVLSPYPGPHDHGYSSAAAIAYALTDYVGDPAAMAAAEAARSRGNTSPRLPRVPPDPVFPAPPAEEPEGPDVDPSDDTEVGLPVFDDEPDASSPGDTPLEETQLGRDPISDPAWRTPDPEPPPPPPPFEEHPERPLFAPDPPGGRPPRPSYEPRATGTDSYWPWGEESSPAPPAPDEEESDDGVPGRSWMRIAWLIAAAVLIGVAVVYAFNQGQSDGNGETATPEEDEQRPQKLSVIQPASVDDLDPQGDGGEENPELTDLTVDGDPSTAWRTSNYEQNFGPSGLKTGVGLTVSLPRTTDVRRVNVTTIGDPTSITLYAGTGEPPADVEGLQPVARGTTTGESVTLATPEAVSADWVIVWLTSLPEDDGFRGQVAEIVVRG